MKIILGLVAIAVWVAITTAFDQQDRHLLQHFKKTPTQTPIQTTANSKKGSSHAICTAPLTLEVANIDKEFELSKEQILEALQSAINEWRDATGRDWFRITSGGSLKVNFLFDGRQSSLIDMEKQRKELEDSVATLRNNPTRTKDDIETLLARIESYRGTYEADKSPVPWAQHHSGQGDLAIDVFAFSDKDQLHATLLHELGHAMGLGHLPQQDAIMYSLRNVEKSDTHLSQYDIEAALSLCENKY